MDGVAERITQALGVSQHDDDDDDDDVNIPLRASKRRSRAPSREGSSLAGTVLTFCLMAFALLFGVFMSFSATYSTAQMAWLGDSSDSKVAADNMEQLADWKKSSTPRAQLTAAEREIADLKRKLRQAQLTGSERKGAQSQSGGGRHGRRHSKTMGGWRDQWGHGDYAAEVERKERQEEDHIDRKLAKEDSDSDKVEEAGLDKAHIADLKRQKAAIFRQDRMAKKLGAADYKKREEEVDSLMPNDANCPGPACLTDSGSNAGGPHSITVVHRHAPWQKHYPGEMDNVMRSTPWVKVSGQSDFARQKAEADRIIPSRATGHRGRKSVARAAKSHASS
jgi:hypothetical protein